MGNNKADNSWDKFLKKEYLSIGRASFLANIFYILIGYIGITYWLNAIRATASSWFVWVLIIIQFILYCSIFSVSYTHFQKCGFNKWLGIILFFILVVLGRIENWEIVIIPMTMIAMTILLSFRHLSEYHVDKKTLQ